MRFWKWPLLPILLLVYWLGMGEDDYPPGGPSWKDFWRFFNS